jgi:lysophospholipase L1-like esterase
MRIFFFGDSLTQGFFDEKGGWAGHLINEYHMRSLSKLNDKNAEWIECFNLGVSGETVEGVLYRLEDEIKARRLYREDEIIVIAIGINDAILRNNRADTDVYKFQETLEKLINKAKKLTKKVLLVGLSAVDESMTNPWPYSSTKKQWHNTRINVFEDTIKQSAIRKEITFVPIHDKFLQILESDKLLSDGLHPNSAGHELIYSLVKPQLEKLLK